VLVLHRSSEDETSTLERLNKMSAPDLRAFVAPHKDSIRLADFDAELMIWWRLPRERSDL
jgi:hypothetical protein